MMPPTNTSSATTSGEKETCPVRGGHSCASGYGVLRYWNDPHRTSRRIAGYAGASDVSARDGTAAEPTCEYPVAGSKFIVARRARADRSLCLVTERLRLLPNYSWGSSRPSLLWR